MSPTQPNNLAQLHRDFLDRLTRKLAAAHQVVGDKVAEELQASVSEPFPPASEPGEPPHRRSGDLERGIGHELVVDQNVTSEIKSTSEHSAPVEFGSSHEVPLKDGGTKTVVVAPRPFMRPSMAKESQEWVGKIAEQMRGK